MTREKPIGGFARETQIKMPRAAAVRPRRVLAILSRCCSLHGYSSRWDQTRPPPFLGNGTPEFYDSSLSVFSSVRISTRFACPEIEVNLMVHHCWFSRIAWPGFHFNRDSWNWNSLDHSDPKRDHAPGDLITKRNRDFRMWSRNLFKVSFVISAILVRIFKYHNEPSDEFIPRLARSSGEHNDATNGSSVGRHNFEEMINYATWESIPNKGNELVFVVFESKRYLCLSLLQ